MENLRDLSVSQVTHSELVEATDFYADTLESHFPENIFVLAIVARIRLSLEKLKQALLALRSSALVEEVGKLDLLRDNAFIMFRDMVGVFAHSADEAKTAAYNRIWPLIKKAGITLYKLGDAKETGKLQSLFLELDKAERQTDMQELTALDYYNALKTAETNFEELTEVKLDEAAKKNIPTIRSSRVELEPFIRDLLPTMRWVALTSEVTSDFSWIGTMNEKTDLLMAQVAARRTRKDNEDNGEEE